MVYVWLTLFHLGSGMTLSTGGRWPALLFNHITQWKVIPPSKTCSQIRFLISRHPLIPLFQQSRKSDPLFLSVKVNHCMCIETSQIKKTPKGLSPHWNEKKLSPISLKFFVWDPLTIRISNFVLCLENNFLKSFWYLFNAPGPPKNFNVKNFNFFLKKKTCRSGFTGSYQIPKGTKS